MRLVVVSFMIALMVGGLTYTVLEKIVGDESKCSVFQSSQGDGYVKVGNGKGDGHCEVTQTP